MPTVRHIDYLLAFFVGSRVHSRVTDLNGTVTKILPKDKMLIQWDPWDGTNEEWVPVDNSGLTKDIGRIVMW